jgi:hypothetical protein
MGHFSMEKPPNPGSVLGGNQQFKDELDRDMLVIKTGKERCDDVGLGKKCCLSWPIDATSIIAPLAKSNLRD